MKKIAITTILLLSFLTYVFSQIVEKGTPYTFEHPELKSIPPKHEMPKFDVAQMLYEDSINIANKALIPYRFAKGFDVNYDLNNSGIWDTLKNGDRIWRLTISSKGAYSLHFIMEPYNLPAGATLFIYNKDHTSVLGALTSKNNKETNVLPTTLIKGDEVTFEYYEPKSVEGQGQIKITKVYHAYRNLFKGEKDSQFGASGSCNVDINCPEGANWQDEKRAVCRIIMGGGLCSGALVNNTAMDGTPYFLTANHCTGEPYANWVFNFKWEVATCGSTTDPYPITSNIPSVSGCQLRATSTNLDFCLVEMSSMPDQTQHEPYWAGWDNSGTPPTTSTGIHHPSGDVKKICIDNDAATLDSYTGYDPNTHWHIAEWDVGVTEGGSSGSPLFNENHHIIGDLTGGQAACGYVFNDYYASFHHSWDDYTPTDQQLKYWLDPLNTGQTTLDGFDFYNNGVNAQFSGTPTTIPVGSSVTFTDQSTPSGSITSWSWDFGDPTATPGQTANTQGPHVVTYNTPGLYTVTLTVSDGTNNDTETKTDYILVEDTVLNADFTASVTTVNVGGSVTFTDMSSPSSSITSWSWDFGDPTATPGQTANTQGPHVVTYNTPGLYTVTLTVSDGTNSDTETKTNYIEVVDPNAMNVDFHASATSIIAGQSVDFFDDTQNGPPISWDWDFGNGLTSTAQNPAGIVYNTPGLYTVSLTASDGSITDTEIKTDYIEVLDSSYLPIADFTSDFTTVFVGNTVNFYDLSQNSPNSWSWTFDGGTPNTSIDQNPVAIQYNTPGVYDVTLVVANAVGTDSITKPGYIVVIDSTYISDTLEARFQAVGSRLIVQGSSVTFQDQSIGYPTTWEWQFGTSGVVPTTSNIQHPTVQYNTPGYYDVTLIVSNGIKSDTLTKYDFIVVTDQPWQDPNGFCDTITNIKANEIQLGFREVGSWGYFPGHNSYTIKAYADKYINYMFSEVSGLMVPCVKAYSASSTGKVRFALWEVDSITGLPGAIMAQKDVLISDFSPYIYHSVHFDSPVPVDGEFYAGFQLYYSSPQDTFVVYMAPDRGINGDNTLSVLKGGSWQSPSAVLGDSLNTSLAINIIGCLVSVDEFEGGGEVLIYPNPSNGKVFVKFNNINVNYADINIFDMTGRKIFQKNNIKSNNVDIDLYRYKSGVYYISINVNGIVINKKIILTN
ncbi:MAG: hypothetical protein Kow0068_17900 [Marinilabiliales bacterium]